ncbi:hypothetical protein LTR56_009460 [Elasticomyces elasticus]|nr:hypothetical protein LTR56_009460 [Elasticomyces elasticus]KAK3645892.1 hypothetical protein LTR22_014558 [Elasticomyces elasticus]KAK4931021.1 hypothetical protein LTR49_002436 [Elasticomyces elasticus]KAK5765488.1 hypothetical protein LTS12_004239 [Elasticomyces elasticus]
MSKPIKRSRRRKADVVVEQGEAAAAVLGLPELLETILLEVDTKTILLSQRVDKMFRNVIAGSQKLLVRLGFQVPSVGDSPEYHIAPLLLYGPMNMGRYSFSMSTGSRCFNVPAVYHGIHVTMEKNMRGNPHATRMHAGRPCQRQHASWRRMILSGGRCPLHFTCIEKYNRQLRMEQHYEIEDGRKGQTMGQVHDRPGKLVLPNMGLEVCKVFCEES